MPCLLYPYKEAVICKKPGIEEHRLPHLRGKRREQAGQSPVVGYSDPDRAGISQHGRVCLIRRDEICGQRIQSSGRFF